MFTVLINNDNTVTIPERQRIMQFSKLVDTLRFIVPKTYNSWDMIKASLVMQYRSPISHKLMLETLTMVDENYKDEYYLYTLPIDTSITAENGTVEINISFKESSMDVHGNVTMRNRNIDTFSIDVIPVANWFTVPDSALDTLTQMYLANQNITNALNDVANTLSANKADNLELDVDGGQLWLKSNGKRVGDPIALNDLGDALAEKTEKGLVKANI